MQQNFPLLCPLLRRSLFDLVLRCNLLDLRVLLSCNLHKYAFNYYFCDLHQHLLVTDNRSLDPAKIIQQLEEHMAVLPLIILHEVVVSEGIKQEVDGGDLTSLFSQLGGDVLQPAVEGLSDQLIMVQEAAHHELRRAVGFTLEVTEQTVVHLDCLDNEHHGMIDDNLVVLVHVFAKTHHNLQELPSRLENLPDLLLVELSTLLGLLNVIAKQSQQEGVILHGMVVSCRIFDVGFDDFLINVGDTLLGEELLREIGLFILADLVLNAGQFEEVASAIVH